MNDVHPSVIRAGYRDSNFWHTMGDGNYIAKGVRIMCNEFHMGNNCKIHNNVFIDGNEIIIGDNVWIGQGSHLDGYGSLIIHDDVTIGYNCYIWTHADRGGLPAYYRDADKYVKGEQTVLHKGVWLMGANVQVNPGVTMGQFSRAYGGSIVTRDTKMYTDYAGVPAVRLRVQR